MVEEALLIDLLLAHQNDFRFSPVDALVTPTDNVPSLSIVIPYYDTGPIIQSVLRHLYDAIAVTLMAYSSWAYEVLLLDDGSKSYPAPLVVNAEKWPNMTIHCASRNRGRVRTRNEGLLKARYEKCLFMDSDILVDAGALLNNLKLHAVNWDRNRNNCITVGLFETRRDASVIAQAKHLNARDLDINDFRVDCIYQLSWIGCDTDRQFVSRHFRLIEETNYFRNWVGMHGPWCLPNMVLGGFFVADRASSLEVNGFDAMFEKYGFTETSLPTKLVANQRQFVIPQVVGGAIHYEGNPTHNDQQTRDKYFKEAHALYFKQYLLFAGNEAVSRPLSGWGT